MLARNQIILIFSILILNVVTARAQPILDTLHIDYRQYKGKLLVVNEFHNVGANNTVYEHIVKQIAAVCAPGDTINIIMESPYSSAFLLNDYLEGRSEVVRQSRQYIRNLRGLPVHVVGVDFEYDNGKRADDYVRCLKAVLNELNNSRVPGGRLREYIDSLKRDTVWQHEGDKKELIGFYTRERDKLQAGSAIYKTITELLFVLNAEHYISSTRHRDKKTFQRLLKAASLGLVKFSNNYNILIHGSQHTDPTGNHNIYRNFLNNSSSPFRNNCFSIAQVYVGCTSSGDYFRHEKSRGDVSIFMGDDINKRLINSIKEKYSGVLPAHSITTFKTMDQLKLPDTERIVCWYVQMETE